MATDHLPPQPGGPWWLAYVLMVATAMAPSLVAWGRYSQEIANLHEGVSRLETQLTTVQADIKDLLKRGKP